MNWLRELWRNLKCRWQHHEWDTISLLEVGQMSQTTYQCKNCSDSFTAISYGWMKADDAIEAVADTITELAEAIE